MKLSIEPFYSRYSPAAVLRATGEDTLAFLQGQFTQELRFPGGRVSTYGLWLNQKGKIVADSFALRDGETWWLVSLTCPVNLIRERLEAYVVADDVVLEDVTHEWRGVALVGEGAADSIVLKGVPLPAAGEWASSAGGFLFRGRRGRGETWEWLYPAGASLPEAIAQSGLREVDETTLERTRLAAGIPRIPEELGLGDLPNEAQLETHAISYSKGCYLGQEVMARLKSMGQVRRRLFPVRGSGAAPHCPAALYVGQKKTGELRSALPEREGTGFVGMAMVSLLGLERDRLFSTEPDGVPRVQIEGNDS